MPAQGRGANLKPSQVKAAPRPPAPKSKPLVLAPPKAAPKVFAEPLSKVTAKNYRTGGGMQRLKAEGKLHEAKHGHALVSLHTLKNVDEKVAGFLGASTAAGSGPLKSLKIIADAEKAHAGKVGEKETDLTGSKLTSSGPINLVGGTAKAFLNKPGPTTVHTLEQVPKVFSSIGGEAVRRGAEVIHGKPLQAVGGFAGSTVESTKHLLGESMKQSQEEAEKEGAANKLLLAAGSVRLGGLAMSAAERTIGSATSESALRKALAKSSTTVRPPIAHRDDPTAVYAKEYTERAGRSGYSKDKTRAAAQKLRDARAPKVEVDGKPILVNQLGHMVPVLKPTRRQIVKLAKRRADLESQRAISAGLRARGGQTKVSRLIEKPGRGRQPVRGHTAQALTQLAAEGALLTAKTFRVDAAKLQTMWEEQLATPRGRTEEELRTLKSNIALVKKAQEDPKIYNQAKAIIAEGERHGVAGRALDQPIHTLGIKPKEQLDRAALSTYAMVHMGAKHYTEAMHNAAEISARVHEDQLRHWADQMPAGSAERAHVEMAWKAAREDRIAVSGKDRAAVLAYEKAHGAAQKAKAAAGAVTNPEASRIAALEKRATQAEAANVPKPKVTEALRTAEGRPLSTEDIAKHVEAFGRDPNTITYVPHVASTGRKGLFYRPLEPGRRPSEERGVRTGAMLRRGELSINREVMHENRVGKATLATAVQQYDKIMKGTKVKPDGVPYTADGIREALKLPENKDMVAVRMVTGNKDLQDIAMGRIEPLAGENFASKLLEDRVLKADDKGSNPVYGLMSKVRYDRLMEQAKPLPKPIRMIQMGRKWFTFSVLAQPKWLLGQFLEPHVIRLTTNGAGLNLAGSAVDFSAWRKTIEPMLKSKDPEKRLAGEIMDSMAEGGNVGRKGRNIVRTHEDFPGSDALFAAHVFRNVPAIKQAIDLYVAIPETIFKANHYIERSAEQISFGKSFRTDFQELSGQWVKTMKLQGQALEDLQNGLIDTPRQERYAREMWTTLGKYDTFGPHFRALTSTIMPFVPWVLNSARFIFWTLPAHHTGLFSAIALAANNVQSEWEEQHKALVEKYGPSFENAYLSKGKVYDTSRLLPTGVTDALVHGDFSELPGLIAPQIRGPGLALEGKTPFNLDLMVPPTASNPKGKPSPWQIAEIFINQALEQTTWGPSLARKAAEEGGSAYANSTFWSPKTKPGTKTGEGIAAAINPLKPLHSKASKEKGLGGSLGGSLGGGLGGKL